MFWGFVRLCLHAYFASDCVCVCHRVFHGCVSDCACVYIACAFSFRVVGLFVCACMIALRGVLCAFVFVMCKVAFRIPRVCISHVNMVSVLLVCLFVLVCLCCE